MEKLAAGLYSADLLLLLWFQLRNRDFALLPQAVSNYGLGDMARLFMLYNLVGSLAAALLAWQFWVAQNPSFPRMVPIYLLAVMAGRIVLGVYPNDLKGAARTRAGKIHHAATMLAFVCAYLAVAEATPELAGEAAGLRYTALTVVKHLITLGFVAVVLTVSAPLRRFFGLAERVFLYATGLWFLTASLILPPV